MTTTDEGRVLILVERAECNLMVSYERIITADPPTGKGHKYPEY
jgi:hypothetical protein